MKKSLLSLLIFNFLFMVSVFPSEDDYLLQVDEDKVGTYLPVIFVDYFEKTLNFETAKAKVPRGCHDVLALQEDICYSTAGYHDGYAIKRDDFAKYKFEERGNDLYITDNKGYEYKRISLIPDCYGSVITYAVEHIFACVDDLKNVEVLGQNVRIEGKGMYSIELDSNWTDTRGCLVLMTGCGLKTEGMSGGFYRLESDGNTVYDKVSDKEFIHFPLLSYEPLIPLEEMSAAELRLYRNLQFARHGYKFKSPDLQEIFSQFEWYVPKESNEGIKLTKEETKIVNECLKLEKAKSQSVSEKDYLNKFFTGQSFKKETFIKNNETYILAYNDIGTVSGRIVNYDKLTISTKAVIYKVIKGNADILLVIDGAKISTNDKLLFEAKMPQEFYGWHIKIASNNLKVYLQPFADEGNVTTESVDFILNDKGEFEKINYQELNKNLY